MNMMLPSAWLDSATSVPLRHLVLQGFGVLDKALFVFDKPFWDTSVDFLLRERPDWSGRWSIFLNYHKLVRGLNSPLIMHLP